MISINSMNLLSPRLRSNRLRIIILFHINTLKSGYSKILISVYNLLKSKDNFFINKLLSIKKSLIFK